MKSEITKIYNAVIISDQGLIYDGYLLIKDGIIIKIGSKDKDAIQKNINISDHDVEPAGENINISDHLVDQVEEKIQIRKSDIDQFDEKIQSRKPDFDQFNEKIQSRKPDFDPVGDDMFEEIRTIDAGGNYLSPGFIDIHVHGGGGHDFMDGTVEAFLAIANLHARYGTTSMLPTTLTSDKTSLLNTLRVYESANKKNKSGARFLGLHFEGPYLAMNQRGAQDPKYIRDPDPAEYKEILALSSSIKRWSAAPELPGAIDFGVHCRDSGVLPAIAHTDAIYEEVVEAFRNGFTLITHLYSAMSGVTRRNAYRYAGVIESAYLIDEMDVELIADGVHMPAPLLKLAYKIKGPDRIALITDAMRAAGMPEGESILGNIQTGLKVIVEDGVAKLPDRSSFAGSVATADRLIRTMINIGEVPLVEAIKMITKTPARIMGVHETIGSIAVGMVADLVIFDKDIGIKQTFIAGKPV